jgi:hypothetical protein
MLGKPLEWLIQGVEKISPEVVNRSATAALRAALSVAIATIPESPRGETCESLNISAIGSTPDFWHKLSVAVTGTAG